LTLRDFVRPLLAELNCREGYRTGVVSNTEALLTRVDLQDLDLIDSFDVIVMSSDVGREKPAQEPFELALSMIEVDPDRAVFLGDNFAADVRGATRVGMRALLISRAARTFEGAGSGKFLGATPPELSSVLAAIDAFHTTLEASEGES
jgi:putative hydrolase of the HAD superfamily